ncbi:hypothetical protein ACFYMW_40390 [Streptomyces sp. NPDC006692]|uniref:hypothetical protein n=1 Tax=unclassified Streptomyces TaxID=2593676 RepID=UPI003693A82E
MPYLIPSRTPLTPDQVERGFDYLLALQLGGGGAVAGRPEADPELAFILLRLAEDIVWPVTAVDAETDLSVDSFALDEVGCVLLSALRARPALRSAVWPALPPVEQAELFDVPDVPYLGGHRPRPGPRPGLLQRRPVARDPAQRSDRVGKDRQHYTDVGPSIPLVESAQLPCRAG